MAMIYASTGNYFKVVFSKCKYTFCIFRIFVLAPAKWFKHKRKDKFVGQCTSLAHAHVTCSANTRN